MMEPVKVFACGAAKFTPTTIATAAKQIASFFFMNFPLIQFEIACLADAPT
jgi:hypothetical protein